MGGRSRVAKCQFFTRSKTFKQKKKEKRKLQQFLALELNKTNKKGYIWRTNIDNSIKLG